MEARKIKAGRRSELVYLASPYTSGVPGVQEEKFKDISRIAAKLTREGYHVFSPIVHGHVMCEAEEVPGDFKFWERRCIDMLSRCDSFAIVKLCGWKQSRGVGVEWWYARNAQMPVYWIEPGNYIEGYESVTGYDWRKGA